MATVRLASLWVSAKINGRAFIVSDNSGFVTFMCGLSDEGTNAAYVEEAENVSVCSKQDQRMVINTEWGAFGEGGELDSILTEFDRQLDEASLYPGKQTYVNSGIFDTDPIATF